MEEDNKKMMIDMNDDDQLLAIYVLQILRCLRSLRTIDASETCELNHHMRASGIRNRHRQVPILFFDHLAAHEHECRYYVQ